MCVESIKSQNNLIKKTIEKTTKTYNIKLLYYKNIINKKM